MFVLLIFFIVAAHGAIYKHTRLSGIQLLQQKQYICKYCTPLLTPLTDANICYDGYWYNVSDCTDETKTGIVHPSHTEVSCVNEYDVLCYCEDACDGPTMIPTESPSVGPTLS